MARIRSLKPEFWTDSKVIGLSAFARLLFIGSWTFARCDQGHLDDDAVALKLKVLPADDVDGPELLEELVECGLIDRYRVDGRTFLHIRRFAENQKLDTRWNSRCPFCPLHNSDEFVGEVGNTPQERKGEEGIGKESKEDAPSFDDFWTSYPLRNGIKGSKKNAKAAWSSLSIAKRTLAVATLPAYEKAANGFPKDAERYLRGELWEGLGSTNGSTSRVPDWKPPPGCEHTENPTPCAACRHKAQEAAKGVLDAIRSKA